MQYDRIYVNILEHFHFNDIVAVSLLSTGSGPDRFTLGPDESLLVRVDG
jgi:hypothetical protein